MASNPFALYNPEQREHIRQQLNAALQSGKMTGPQIGGIAKTLQSLAEVDQPAEMFQQPEIPGNLADTVGEWGGAVGGTIGGLAGAVPPVAPFVGGPVGGALLGGMAGRTVGRSIQAGLGEKPVPATPWAAVADVASAGAIEGALEGGGRAIASGLGVGVAAARNKLPVLSKMIGGHRMPETAGSAFGRRGGLRRTLESYFTGAWPGRPLREVGDLQQNTSWKILADLAESAAPGAGAHAEFRPAENWARAREATRATAQPLYEQISKLPAPETASKTANEILQNPQVAAILNTRSKRALSELTRGGADDVAQVLGYKTEKEALSQMGEKAFNTAAEQIRPQLGTTTEALTMGDIISARHELFDAAKRATDAGDQRLLFMATDELRSVLKELPPAERKILEEADTLWRRSYIMDEFAKGLEKMGSKQPVKDQTVIVAQDFAKLVDGLVHKETERVGRAGSKILKSDNELAALFPNKADRTTLIELSDFLSHKAVKNAAGVTDALAKIGVALIAFGAGTAAIHGDFKTAAGALSTLEMYYMASAILAKPGGAVLLKQYFNRPTAAAAAALVRTAFHGLGNTEATPRYPNLERWMTGPD